MTLITYGTRVHFADGVLEEALRSELDAVGRKRVMLVIDMDDLTGPGLERICAALPVRSTFDVYTDVAHLPTPAGAAKLGAAIRQAGADVILAFGRRRAISLAKIARLHMTSGGRLVQIGRKAPPENAALPLIAVPGLDGVCAAVGPQTPLVRDGGRHQTLVHQALLPDVAICDPTLLAGAPPAASASAGVDVIARCVECFLSGAYNPPADGMALDGLRRASANLARVLDDIDPGARREMMAADLNGALAQQKGQSTGEALALALSVTTGREIDPGALSRLVLPGLVSFHAYAAREKFLHLRRALSVSPQQALATALHDMFDTLPLPRSLSQMGLSAADLQTGAALAAEGLTGFGSPRSMHNADLRDLMCAVL